MVRAFYIMISGDIIPFHQITLFRGLNGRDERQNGDIALGDTKDYGLGNEYHEVKVAYLDWLASLTE